MPSPFPGMDPYLEGSLWPDVHGSLIYTIRAAIAAELPPGYFAEMGQYVWVQEADGRDKRLGQPDVVLANGHGTVGSNSGGVALAEPTSRTTLTSPKKKKGNRYIRIVDKDDKRVLTVIELPSPSNKEAGEDRDNYIAKRKDYLATGTNLVEIDLLRSGDRIPLGKPTPPPADYYILVSRANAFPRAEVWAFTVRDAIPDFPVPLGSGDSPIPLQLRPCLDRAYDDAHYGSRIDYHSLPDPPFISADVQWAEEMLKKHAKKKKK